MEKQVKQIIARYVDMLLMEKQLACYGKLTPDELALVLPEIASDVSNLQYCIVKAEHEKENTRKLLTNMLGEDLVLTIKEVAERVSAELFSVFRTLGIRPTTSSMKNSHDVSVDFSLVVQAIAKMKVMAVHVLTNDYRYSCGLAGEINKDNLFEKMTALNKLKSWLGNELRTHTDGQYKELLMHFDINGEECFFYPDLAVIQFINQTALGVKDENHSE